MNTSFEETKQMIDDLKNTIPVYSTKIKKTGPNTWKYRGVTIEKLHPIGYYVEGDKVMFTTNPPRQPLKTIQEKIDLFLDM